MALSIHRPAGGTLRRRARTQGARGPLRVAMFTTSYPRDAADLAGRFVFNTVEHLRARAVIGCSEQLAEAMRSCGLKNVHAIPYGVDVPGASRDEDEEPFVLYAGRLSPEKNIDVIAQATAGLPRVIAGDGPLRHLVPD